MDFSKINEIKIENTLSWENKIFLTFDLDWCSDDILSFSLDILEKFNLKATIFITHRTKLQDRMEANKNIELGIHPNFNPLINGEFAYGKNFEEVFHYYKKIYPKAVSIRSHSLTQQSSMLDYFSNNGIIYDCNLLIPDLISTVKPFINWDNRLIRVPFIWEDDTHCAYKRKYSISNVLKSKSVKVFDFHPIHIFLNTEKLSRYEKAKLYLKDINKLKKFINNKNFGTRDFLIKIIQESKNENRNYRKN